MSSRDLLQNFNADYLFMTLERSLIRSSGTILTENQAMKDNNNLVSIYSGTESSVLLLKGRLDRMGIASEIRKESTAGTWGIIPNNIELFIDPAQEKEAQPILNEFIRNRRVDGL